MVFNTNEGGVIKQVIDINVETENLVTIGTPTNDAGLKVYGTLTINETAFERDLLPVHDGGGQYNAGIGSPDRRWDDLHLYDEAIASFGGDVIGAVSLTHKAKIDGSDPGLVVNGTSRIYFDDGANFDQYIGSSGTGITNLVSQAEMEINGGLLLDLDGGEVTMHATGSDGMVIEATTGDLTINVPAAGKKVLFNSNDDGIIAHSANANEQDFTIEQIGAHDASLFINSAGTGADALKLATTAGGMDISVTGTADLEDLDITTIGINTEIRMTSASTQDDAIDIESDGGIDITAAGIMDITSDGVMNITSDGVMNITTSAAASNITVDPNGAGTLALGTADNTACLLYTSDAADE